jgi:hypothetical protein
LKFAALGELLALNPLGASARVRNQAQGLASVEPFAPVLFTFGWGRSGAEPDKAAAGVVKRFLSKAQRPAATWERTK